MEKKKLLEQPMWKYLAVLLIAFIAYLFSVNIKQIRQDVEFIKSQCIQKQ